MTDWYLVLEVSASAVVGCCGPMLMSCAGHHATLVVTDFRL